MQHQQYQQFPQYQPMQMRTTQNAPNASIATMGPDTYQNSPYTQQGFQMGQQYQQQNQQQQEQGWLQQVRQELHSGQTLRPQMGKMPTTMGQQGQNASLATMDPTTYQNSPYVSQQDNKISLINNNNLSESKATSSEYASTRSQCIFSYYGSNHLPK